MMEKIKFKDLDKWLKAIVIYVWFQFSLFVLGLLIFAFMIAGY